MTASRDNLTTIKKKQEISWGIKCWLFHSKFIPTDQTNQLTAQDVFQLPSNHSKRDNQIEKLFFSLY